MSEIIRPDSERLAVIYCPHFERHKDDEAMSITFGSQDGHPLVVNYFVVRMVYTLNGKVHRYLDPPPEFAVALAESFCGRWPSVPILFGEGKCAECSGFENPGYYRKPFNWRGGR